MRNSKRRNGFAWLVLLLALCVIALSGYKLKEIQRTYRVGDESYKELLNLVRPGGAPPVIRVSEAPYESSNEEEMIAEIEVPDMSIDFPVLETINPDAAAWLYSPDTVIDYPVMRANDYDYYLHHLPDGTQNANGTLFIDYNCSPDFSDKLTIVYGHNMKSGKMFGSIVGYKKQSYYEQHPYMYLYLDGTNYRIDLMYGCVIGVGEWRERAFMFSENLSSFLAYASHTTTFTSEVELAQSDRIIAMSTCSYEFDGARYVLIGVLRPEHENSVAPIGDTTSSDFIAFSM